MVIKKCNEKGEWGIDWVKSLVSVGLVLGLALYSLKLSTEANAGVRELKVETHANSEMLKTLVSLHVGKEGK